MYYMVTRWNDEDEMLWAVALEAHKVAPHMGGPGPVWILDTTTMVRDDDER